jgi:hypothetical protein
MKILKWMGWASAILGTVLLVMGVVSQVFKLNIFDVQHNVSFVHAANAFFLLAIAVFIVTKKCCSDCCCDKDEK